MRIRHFPALLFAALFLAVPTSSPASSLSIDNGVLAYTADPGEDNQVGLNARPNGEYEVYDNASVGNPNTGAPGITIRVGNGCRVEPPTSTTPISYVCDSSATSARIALNDADDEACTGVLSIPVTVSGGEGYDTAAVGCGAQSAPAAKVSLDGVADDGPAGRDNYLPDNEIIVTGPGADELTAGKEAAVFRPRGGNDVLRGGPGPDSFVVAAVGSVGDELGSFSAGGTDTVTCGRGADFVLADKKDKVARDCEVVGRPNGFDRSLGQNTYRFTGTRKADFINPPYGWTPNTVLAGAGNDRIVNGIDVRAGAGNDRVSRPEFDEKQTVSGEAGNDTIDVRDKQPKFKTSIDTVKCGTGKDTVYANKNDKIARDCEKVKRVK